MSVVASGVSRLKEARTKARAKVRSIDAEIVALQEKRAGLLETEARLDEEVDLITAGSTEKLHAAARAMDMAEMAAALDMGADIDRPGIGVSLDGLTRHTQFTGSPDVSLFFGCFGAAFECLRRGNFLGRRSSRRPGGLVGGARPSLSMLHA